MGANSGCARSSVVLFVVVPSALRQMLRDGRRAGDRCARRHALGGPAPGGLRLLLDVFDLVLRDFFRRRPSGAPAIPRAAVSVRSSRFTASAKRRYVSTLAMTMRASIVTSSMPMTETRTNASMTIPLSRMTSSTSDEPRRARRALEVVRTAVRRHGHGRQLFPRRARLIAPAAGFTAPHPGSERRHHDTGRSRHVRRAAAERGGRGARGAGRGPSEQDEGGGRRKPPSSRRRSSATR